MAPYKIGLEAVESSNISALGYDTARSIMAVEFKTGHVYHWAGVSLDTFFKVYGARNVEGGSIGRAFNQLIKGQYTGQKMTGLCPKCGAIGWVGETCEDCGCAEVLEEPRKDQATDGEA